MVKKSMRYKHQEEKDPIMERIFRQGEEMIKNEMNMYTLLETILKIKATLTVLVGNDESILKTIQNHYLSNATIHLDKESIEKIES